MSELKSFHADNWADDWQVIVVKSRVDSINQQELKEEIRQRIASGHKKIALDLKGNRFFSMPAIKDCVDAANTLKENGGTLALISCPERTRRHFEIYGSLSHIRVFRSDRELSA